MVGFVPYQSRHLAGDKPRHTAQVSRPDKGETPVTFDAVPAEHSRRERFSRHRFDRVAVKGFDVADVAQGVAVDDEMFLTAECRKTGGKYQHKKSFGQGSRSL